MFGNNLIIIIKIMFWFQLDIVNQEQWGDEQYLSFFKDRLNKMRAKRGPFDTMWDNAENSITAVSFYDNQWMLQVNIPLEKTLKEIYMWRTEWKVNFDIVPDWQANVEELQPSKYALQFFLDWNGKDNFWKENRYLRANKCDYGSAIFYTWIRSYKDFRFKVKEWVEIQDWVDLLNKWNFEKSMNETWFFFPKSIHPKDFYIDDACYWVPDVQYANDCIMKEKMTAVEFNNRFKDNKAFMNLDQVTYWNDIYPKNKDDRSIDTRQIVIYHYFNRITKNYLIVANETVLIYNWLYLYNDWKLPFVNVQHFSNNNRFRWEGFYERIGYLKAYKSEIFQDILSGAAMSSWITLLTWNDDQIWQDWTVWGRQMNIWRTTWGAERVQQINTSPNLTYFTAVLDLIDKQTTIDSWVNPLEQFDPMSDKVWIVEIMEANKAIRNRSVDENYNIGLDEALTMMLDRIKQFAPSLLKEEIKWEDWKVLKTIFPKITIEWYTVEKEKGKQVFVENLGKYWYFELKPWIVQWVWVKVITPSTNSTLPILERQKVTEYVNNLFQMGQLAQLDPTGQLMNKLKDWVRFDELLKWIWDAYWYDINWLKANTEKDKLFEENKKKLEAIKQLMQNNLQSNTPTNVWQNTWIPMQGQTPSNSQPIQQPTWQNAWQNPWAEIWFGW